MVVGGAGQGWPCKVGVFREWAQGGEGSLNNVHGP